MTQRVDYKALFSGMSPHILCVRWSYNDCTVDHPSVQPENACLILDSIPQTQVKIVEVIMDIPGVH